MKNFAYSLASLGIMFLMAGSMPGTLSGQSQPPTQNKTADAAPAPESVEACPPDSKAWMEQLKGAARINQQELQEQVTNLSEKIAKEVEMNAPEIAKMQQTLSARFLANQQQWDANAQELASRAKDLAAQAQDKASQDVEVGPQAAFVLPDEGSGWLGVEIGEVTPERAKDLRLTEVRGVEVVDVEPDSPAGKSGLKEHDVIMRYDGQAVEGTVQFRRLVRETPSGRKISLTISRDGATQDISIEVGDRSDFYEKKMKGKMRDFGNAYVLSEPNFDLHMDAPGVFTTFDVRSPMLGIGAEDLSSQLGAYFGAPNGAGVLVREVRPGTAAEKAGIRAGDVIIKIDGKPVASLSELRQQLREKSDAKSVSLGILRKGSEMSVPVTIEKQKPVESTGPVRRAQL